MNQYADAAMTVSDVLGQETAIGKTLAVAASLINTYTAISGQLKAFSGIPIPGYAIAQAIATGLVGFKQVSSILKVKVPGKNSGGGSAPSMGGLSATVPTPQFNVAGNAGVNQIASTLANQQPIKAYVVGKEVSTQQSLDRNIVKNATLG